MLTVAVMARRRDLTLADVPVFIEFAIHLAKSLVRRKLLSPIRQSEGEISIKPSYALGSYHPAFGVDDTILATTTVNVAILRL